MDGYKQDINKKTANYDLRLNEIITVANIYWGLSIKPITNFFTYIISHLSHSYTRRLTASPIPFRWGNGGAKTLSLAQDTKMLMVLKSEGSSWISPQLPKGNVFGPLDCSSFHPLNSEPRQLAVNPPLKSSPLLHQGSQPRLATLAANREGTESGSFLFYSPCQIPKQVVNSLTS
jgi:hypothetical protein